MLVYTCMCIFSKLKINRHLLLSNCKCPGSENKLIFYITIYRQHRKKPCSLAEIHAVGLNC